MIHEFDSTIIVSSTPGQGSTVSHSVEKWVSNNWAWLNKKISRDMNSGMRIVYLCRLNKGFGLKFYEVYTRLTDTWRRQDSLKGQKFVDNNKDENVSLQAELFYIIVVVYLQTIMGMFPFT